MSGFLGIPKVQFFDGNSVALDGGKVHTYEPGTTTNKASYPTIADAKAKTNANANPVILDSRGEADIVLAGNTKLLLKAADNTTIWTLDNVNGDADILDANGNEMIVFNTVASAVNFFKLSNSATGNNIILEPDGSDTDIGITIQGKGTGAVTITGLTATSLVDSNSVDTILTSATASAINEFTAKNAAIGDNPQFQATGDDTNIGIEFTAKGNEFYHFLGTADTPAEVRLNEDTDNGTNYIGLKSPASVSSSVSFTLPSADGSSGQFIKTDGSAVLSFVDVGTTTVLVGTATPSAAATVEFTGLSSTYFAYVLDMQEVIPATDDAGLIFRMSVDNGSTFISSAGAYKYAANYVVDDGTTGAWSDTADTLIDLTLDTATNGVGTGTNESLEGRIILYNPSAVALKKITWQVCYTAAAPALIHVGGGAVLSAVTTAVDAIQVSFTTGNIESGEFRLYGIKAV